MGQRESVTPMTPLEAIADRRDPKAPYWYLASTPPAPDIDADPAVAAAQARLDALQAELEAMPEQQTLAVQQRDIVALGQMRLLADEIDRERGYAELDLAQARVTAIDNAMSAYRPEVQPYTDAIAHGHQVIENLYAEVSHLQVPASSIDNTLVGLHQARTAAQAALDKLAVDLGLQQPAPRDTSRDWSGRGT
jgi:hypothetical protein